MKNKDLLLRFLVFWGLIHLIDGCKPKEETQNLRRPEIITVNPVSAQVGDSIEIVGRNFSEIPTENLVSFNGKIIYSLNNNEVKVSFQRINARVLFASRGRLRVEVPQGAITGRLDISVRGTSLLEPQDFFIFDSEAPMIDTLVPMVGRAGDIVTISGKGFSEQKENNGVSLNSVSCEVIEASPTELKVVIPATASAGRISVVVNGRRGQSRQIFEFKLAPPVIDSVSLITDRGRPTQDVLQPLIFPSKLIEEDQLVDENSWIIIWGKNFSLNATSNLIFFERQLASPAAIRAEYAGRNYLVVRIPSETIDGNIKVRVFGQEAISQQVIKIKPTNTWKARLSLPIPSSQFNEDYYSWAIGEKIYVMAKNRRDLWCYDPNGTNAVGGQNLGSWQKKAAFGVALGGGLDPEAAIRNMATTFVAGGKAYLLAGRSTTLLDIWCYDPITDTWSRKQDFVPEGFPGVEAADGSLVPFTLQGALAWNIDNKVYVGFNKGNSTNQWILPVQLGGPGRATEDRRIWEYDFNSDVNFNRSVNRGVSTAWKEIGDFTAPGFNLRPSGSAVPGKYVVSVAVFQNRVYGLLNDPSDGDGNGNTVFFMSRQTDPGNPEIVRFTDYSPISGFNKTTDGEWPGILLSTANRLYFISGTCINESSFNAIVPGGITQSIYEVTINNQRPQLNSLGVNYGTTEIYANGVFLATESGRIFAGLGNNVYRDPFSGACGAGVNTFRPKFFEYIP